MTERLTREQAAILSAYTGVLLGPFSDMHEYIENILRRPVWTHEMASESLSEEIRVAAMDDAMNLVAVKGPDVCENEADLDTPHRFDSVMCAYHIDQANQEHNADIANQIAKEDAHGE
jgi:hypothetical protein